jgi:hypothetical protein
MCRPRSLERNPKMNRASLSVPPLQAWISDKKTALLMILIARSLLLSGCGETPTAPSTQNRAPAAPSTQIATGQARLLTSEHLGWKNRDCEVCHRLPVQGHATNEPPDCAECHGGNGACNPNGLNSEREHDIGDECIDCHEGKHEFELSSECVSCHFATAGLDDCAVTNLSGALRGNCFNWPEEEFTPTHKANVKTSLAEGAIAVDFTLKDPHGASHSLSSLLATKPVLLVFGAFT